MNNVNLIGRLTKDPEVREIKGKDGMIAQASFFLAIDRGNDEADFIRCVAFGKTAEVIEDYTGKGTRIGVSGHIRTGSYEHKDGYTVYTFDVIVDRFDFADGKAEEASSGERGRSRKKKGGR